MRSVPITQDRMIVFAVDARFDILEKRETQEDYIVVSELKEPYGWDRAFVWFDGETYAVDGRLEINVLLENIYGVLEQLVMGNEVRGFLQDLMFLVDRRRIVQMDSPWPDDIEGAEKARFGKVNGKRLKGE